MSRLESWQRYRKATPCPICGGYGAYKEELKCAGFLAASGEGAWCQKDKTGVAHYFDAIGMNLYWHSLVATAVLEKDLKRERGSQRKKLIKKGFVNSARSHLVGAKPDPGYSRPPHPREFG